jgi:lysophospholipid acyltransferase
MGLLIQVYMYGKGFIPSTSYVIISYIVMWLFPRHVSHYIVFVVNAALLSATHIHKMIYYDKFWGADITAVMMLNLCKISAIAINYRDGSVPVAKRDTELKSREKEYLVEKLPSFYEYMGYMYYCGGTIAGPFFEYKDYTNFINRTNHYSSIPTTIVPTLIRFATAIFFIVVNSLLGDTFYPEYLLTDDYAQKHFVYKYAYALCTLKLKIFTYYTAFCLMHTATIASGLAFNGYDENKKAKFNKVETVRIWDIEFSYHVKDFFDAWNISVHKWLKYYVFLRIVKKG